MSDFKYKPNELFCENVKVRAIAEAVGTPCYIYSSQSLVSQFLKLKKAFAAINPLICFAMKANDNLAVVKTLVKQGAGCDIVSGGELKKALAVETDPQKIVYASVGKTEKEIEESLNAGILLFNVESLPELEEIERIAVKLGKKAKAALRINPDVKAATHDRITTGTLQKKFGIDLTTAHKILKNKEKYTQVDVVGIHMHIGSQITSKKPFITAIKKVAVFIEELKADGIALEYFDIGGGFGIVYNEEDPFCVQDFADSIIPVLKKTGLKIIMEPGRFICGNAGILVTQALYIKDNGVKKFLIVDSGMNDLVRPSMYDAYHEIIPLRKMSWKKEKMDIVGPICESGDYFAKDRPVYAAVKKGDFLAIMSAGAYGHVMSSNYNSRTRCAEVLVKGNKYYVVRERETYADLVRGQVVPDFIK
ncbi:MAG: diaminopimelate decarboxylase [Candidatus Omnitrophica bacterium]|nr:diaminopimelate decarboxylase [Candidatus Omnitrophota bacterium]